MERQIDAMVTKPGDLQPIPRAAVESVDIAHSSRSRVACVRCPFCSGLHEHDWPLGKTAVGIVKAPCRDICNETAVETTGLLELLEYASRGQNLYNVKVGKGFESDCEHVRKKV